MGAKHTQGEGRGGEGGGAHDTKALEAHAPFSNRKLQLTDGTSCAHLAGRPPSTKTRTRYHSSRYSAGAFVLHTIWFGVLWSCTTSHSASPMNTWIATGKVIDHHRDTSASKHVCETNHTVFASPVVLALENPDP